MTIDLKDAGRRFNQEWIFRNFSYQFSAAGKYAILGPNGSGKSTLLSVILGSLAPSEGSVTYTAAEIIPVEKIYTQLSFAAPYLDLVEEFTLQETIEFHFKFKSFYPGLSSAGLMDILGLAKSQDKALKYFSSGMKQRTKLALACCTDTPILLLDEPTSNLDVQGIGWYHELIKDFTAEKLVLVGSNQEIEYSFCENLISITDYKD
ncbi:ABC-type multidrug transport system, ATPase component [Pedobacter westerhofensis]|uniref:ABC-type multidrug transport system, ATPase component n=1 Tax=Pedobacter westerhofensis TaxID=425512 RepID=A0A521DVV1_9SPHI|nr:ATP-binding cassette domain-containing protein [Pedobacter westerhofensis]SMO75874.1 ABC-type multidrug transport system, ATPase component [Pedobacter westerhofensis]